MHSTARSNTFRNSTKFQGALTWLIGSSDCQGAMTSRIITLAVAASASYRHVATCCSRSKMHLNQTCSLGKLACTNTSSSLLRGGSWRSFILCRVGLFIGLIIERTSLIYGYMVGHDAFWSRMLTCNCF